MQVETQDQHVSKFKQWEINETCPSVATFCGLIPSKYVS